MIIIVTSSLSAVQNLFIYLLDLHIIFMFFSFCYVVILERCLQCFDAVGWAAGRASGV